MSLTKVEAWAVLIPGTKSLCLSFPCLQNEELNPIPLNADESLSTELTSLLPWIHFLPSKKS